MVHQLCWRGGHTVPRQIGWRRAGYQPVGLQWMGDDRTVRQRTNSDHHLITLFKRIDQPIAEFKIDLHFRKPVKITGHKWRQAKRTKRDRGADLQRTGRPLLHIQRNRICFLHLCQHDFAAFEIVAAHIRQTLSSGGAMQKQRTEMLLQHGDMLRHHLR